MHKPPPGSKLPRSKPSEMINVKAMKAAIALSIQEMEQLTVFSEVFAPLATTSVFAHLLPTAVEAGLIRAGSCGSAAVGSIIPSETKRRFASFFE